MRFIVVALLGWATILVALAIGVEPTLTLAERFLLWACEAVAIAAFWGLTVMDK